MTLTYTTLKSDILDWAQDNSTELTAQLDNIIDMAELRLSRDLLVIAFDTTASGSFVTGNQNINRPSDLVTTRYIKWSNAGTWTTLERKTLTWMFEYWPTPATTGSPLYYSEDSATQFIVAPTPSSTYTYEVGYTRRLPALTSGNPTNWLTDNAEDALRYACLVESSAYKIDAAQTQVYAGLYQNAVSRINNEFTRTLRDDLRAADAITRVENVGAQIGAQQVVG